MRGDRNALLSHSVDLLAFQLPLQPQPSNMVSSLAQAQVLTRCPSTRPQKGVDGGRHICFCFHPSLLDVFVAAAYLDIFGDFVRPGRRL